MVGQLRDRADVVEHCATLRNYVHARKVRMYLRIQRAELTVDRQDAVDECHPATAEAVADEVKEQYGSTYAQSLTFGAIKHQITSVGATVLTGFSMVPRNVVQQIYHGGDDVAQVKLTPPPSEGKPSASLGRAL